MSDLCRRGNTTGRPAALGTTDPSLQLQPSLSITLPPLHSLLLSMFLPASCFNHPLPESLSFGGCRLSLFILSLSLFSSHSSVSCYFSLPPLHLSLFLIVSLSLFLFSVYSLSSISVSHSFHLPFSINLCFPL